MKGTVVRSWAVTSSICVFMGFLCLLSQWKGVRLFYTYHEPSSSDYPYYSEVLNKTLSTYNYSWYRDYSLGATHVQSCPRAKKWIYIYTQGRSGSTMLGRLLRSSNTQCNCDDTKLNDLKQYYLFEPLHAFPGNLSVSQVNSVYRDITSCNISPIFPRLKADSMISKIFSLLPLICPFSMKDMDVDATSFGCIFLTSRQLDIICSKACVGVIKDIRLKTLGEDEQKEILTNLLTSNENLQIIYLSRDPRGVFNSMNNTKVFNARFSSICGFTNSASRIVSNLSTVFGSNRIFEVTYESLATDPFAAIFDLFTSKLHITFSIDTVNWIVENMLRSDKNSDSSRASRYSTKERNALAEAFKWKTAAGTDLQKAFENNPICQKSLISQNNT